MKKIIAVILVLCMAVTLSACGKSQSVKDVEKAISAIGKVTLESGEDIEKAERMYDYLTETEKSKVDNKGDLVEARYAYDKIYEDEVYTTAKKAYELLNEAARMYYFHASNFYRAGNFGKNANMIVTAGNFCEKYASVIEDYQSYPKYTEAEVREALELTRQLYEEEGWAWDGKANMVVCMNIHHKAFYEVRGYKPNRLVEEAGVLLLELNDTYHDEKYYPVLLEYRDIVASGDAITLNSSNLNDLPPMQKEFLTAYTQYELKLDPMFVK